MEIIIVTRHKGAIDWLHNVLGVSRDIPILTGNVGVDDVRGKYVIGNIPFSLAVEAKKVSVIEFDGIPPRGVEYTADDMVKAGARLATYEVKRVFGSIEVNQFIKSTQG